MLVDGFCILAITSLMAEAGAIHEYQKSMDGRGRARGGAGPRAEPGAGPGAGPGGQVICCST